MPDLLDDILPGEPTASDERQAAYTLAVFLDAEELITLDQLAVLMKVHRLQVFRELLRRAAPSPNGSAYEVACFGCGKQIMVKRRPTPGKRSWCDTCKASGEPAAQRARDYRSRKGEQT